MSAIDRHKIATGIYSALDVTAVRALIGNPVRLYVTTPREAAYPWCRMTFMPAPPVTRYKPGGGAAPKYVIRHVVEFWCVENVQSTVNVSAAIAAIAVIMDKAPANITVSGGTVTESIRRMESAGNDPETNGVFAAIEYELQLDV